MAAIITDQLRILNAKNFVSLVPTPYYLPDDFVYIDLDIGTSEVDIKQGDTITVSGSEVYTIIHGCFNKYQSTAGIFFCARTT